MMKSKFLYQLSLLTITVTQIFAQGHKLDFSPVRQLIRTAMKKDDVPSFAIAVVKDGRILWEQGIGFADTARKIKASGSTAYYIASVTKSITASALMILKERHQLDLDSPINIYLGSDTITSAYWDPRGATVRRIASHTAGITTFDFQSFNISTNGILNLDQAINCFGFLCWPPGRFDYSNLDYGILTKAIEHITGESYANFLESEIFHPLHMTHSYIGPDKSKKRFTATNYSYQYGPRPMILSIASGASAGYSCAHDLALFALWQLKAPLNLTKTILSSQAITFMHEQTVATGYGGQVENYGIGWWVGENSFGYKTVIAQGGTEDASALIELVPSEKLAIVVLSNKGSDALGSIADKVFTIVTNPNHPKPDSGHNARAQATSSRAVLPDSIAGDWKGIIRTCNGELPLRLSVDKSGKVEAKIGEVSLRQLKVANFDSASRIFYTKTNVDTNILRASDPGPHDIGFLLYAHDGILTGAATTSPQSSKKSFALLSYWVQLSRL